MRKDIHLPSYLECLFNNVNLFFSAISTELGQDEGLKRKVCWGIK